MDIIETLYETFSKYQLNEKMDKCPCGCISDEEERKIYSKNLRELTAEDIGFYSNKAMTTWGNEENYKYFLPRIIEIYTEDKVNGRIDLYSIHNKLKHANLKEWDDIEQEVIIEFVRNEWKDEVNKSERKIWETGLESYLNYFSFQDLLEMWEFPENKIALQKFVEFFYSNGNRIFYSNKNMNYNGVNRQKEILDLIKRDNLTESLEKEYFENEVTDEEYADKISIVLQMIEDELKKEKT